jgi:hypothetical protein
MDPSSGLRGQLPCAALKHMDWASGPELAKSNNNSAVGAMRAFSFARIKSATAPSV